MTKKILAVLSLLLLTAPAASAQAQADWVKFSPPESPFTILLPAQPKEDKKTSDGPHGPYTATTYASRSPQRELYYVGWVDYDPKFNFGVQAEMEANRDNFIKDIKATLLSTTPIKLGNHPGIEFKAKIEGKADIVSRVYIVGRRPYQLMAVVPTGQDASANLERFFSSFKLGAAK